MPDPVIANNPLPYAQALASRDMEVIDLVVIHCTELPDLKTAREYGQRIHYPEPGAASGTGNAGHYYIDRDGRIEQWLPIERIAHHVRGFNEHSIGIELVNNGRYPDWFDSNSQAMKESYPLAQIDALCTLLMHLAKTLDNLRWISGHESLDTEQVSASDDPLVLVQRKRDPGELFPWERLLSSIPLQKLETTTPR